MKKKPSGENDSLSYRDLVARVRQLVADSGVTQAYLAGKLGVPQPLISRALKVDHPRPVPSTVLAIAAALGEEWEEVVSYRRAVASSTKRRGALPSSKL